MKPEVRTTDQRPRPQAEDRPLPRSTFYIVKKEDMREFLQKAIARKGPEIEKK